MRKQIFGILVILIITLLMGLGIYLTQEYRFYNMESNNMFLYDGADILYKLQQTGGLALLMASFISQFMWLPGVGVCVMVILYLLVGWITFQILQYRKSGLVMVGLSLLPVTFLYLCIENDSYSLHGHTAYLLMLLTLWIYLTIPSSRWKLRCIIGITLIPLLYQFAGSVAVVFALVACMVELFDKGMKGIYALSYPLMAILTAYILVVTSRVNSWDTALTPFMYYNWPSTYYFPLYAWGMIPLLWLLAWGMDKIKMNQSSIYLCAILGLVLSFYLAGNLYIKVHSKRNYRFLQEQYWVEQEKWDTIIETADRRQSTFFISYLNLALAKKGMLVQRLKQYNQQPISKLMYADPVLKNGMSLQSKVYMEWGYVGAARQAAFDANLVTPGSCHPRQLQILIQSNLVLGSYRVAEKYIGWLEKTLFYKDWAQGMRKYLDNQELISQDEYLGKLYRSLPSTDEYVKYNGISGDMKDILKANPSNHIMSQFYEAFQMMEKGGKS